jgi:hypothetical protein
VSTQPRRVDVTHFYEVPLSGASVAQIMLSAPNPGPLTDVRTRSRGLRRA